MTIELAAITIAGCAGAIAGVVTAVVGHHVSEKAARKAASGSCIQEGKAGMRPERVRLEAHRDDNHVGHEDPETEPRHDDTDPSPSRRILNLTVEPRAADQDSRCGQRTAEGRSERDSQHEHSDHLGEGTSGGRVHAPDSTDRAVPPSDTSAGAK